MTQYADTARGDRVAYDLHGAGGPVVIFVAGAGPFRATDPVTLATAKLAADEGLRAIVYDRLGRGESFANGVLDLEREVAAIEALMPVVGGKAILCGHSSGCAIAMRAAATNPPVQGLVLWEAPIFQIGGGAAAWAFEIKRRIANGDREGALEHYMKDMPPEWLQKAKTSPVYPQMVADVVTYVADAEALAWAESDSTDRLLGRTLPVELLVGEQTFPAMTETARKLATMIQGASNKQLPGAQHAWEPAPMSKELARFARTIAA